MMAPFLMSENTVNNEESLNSQSSQLEEEDIQKLQADSEPVNERKKTACNSSTADGEVHVSSSASSQTHSVDQLCQTVNLAIVLLI